MTTIYANLIAKADAELTEAGYDMTRSWVALVVDGTVYGVGRTEAKALRDAREWIDGHNEDCDPKYRISDDQHVFVPITEHQAGLTDGGHVDIVSLIKRH